jgi:diguanylate cyclase (GGDEF)-like protein
MANAHTVIVVDDDQSFRETVAAILKPRGFTVLEAKNAQEATSIVASVEPLVVIVDYRLPGTDGVTWITQVRDQGRKFPIVFISADWCDAKTFNWLRNILQVSLILTKPIVPTLFLQQIEPLLPGQVLDAINKQADASEDEAILLLDKLLEDKEAVSKQTIAELEQVANSATSEADLLAKLRQFEMKMKVEKQLRKARSGYAQQLLDEWHALEQLVQTAQHEPENRMVLNEALQASHRLAGSAGTFGFTAVGEIARKIEGYLKAYDPVDTLQEVLWNETFRALAEGETLAKKAIAEDQQTDGGEEPLSQILIVGAENKYKQFADAFSETHHLSIVVADSSSAAMNRAKKSKFDGLIVDLTLGHKMPLLFLIEQVRSAAAEVTLPVAVISDAEKMPERTEAIFYGISEQAGAEISHQDLEVLVSRLRAIGQARKPRVLVVDDDEKLSAFVATILGGEDIVVETLSAPIRIMEVLQQFQPDVVILDVMMPGLSGYDVCRMIRHHDQFRSLPVIFLTSKSTAEGRAAAFQAGGNDFLSKPVLAPELLARVHGQIDKLELKAESAEDAGAGLLTRKAFMTFLAEKLELAQQEKQSLSVCLINFDEFLELGILHSMFSVEQALLVLSRLMKSHFRAEDLRGRFAEETFALACYGEAREHVASAVDMLLSQFEELKFSSVAYGNFKASFSAGIASFPEDASNIADLLTAANQKMNAGRMKGLGKVTA